MHYKRWQLTGDVGPSEPLTRTGEAGNKARWPLTEEERFSTKYSINPDSGCWNWLGFTNDKYKYGVFYIGQGRKRAHVWSYEKFIGSIPQGHEIDHLCRNTKCVNPEHLEAVTRAENMRRHWEARKNPPSADIC